MSYKIDLNIEWTFYIEKVEQEKAHLTQLSERLTIDAVTERYESFKRDVVCRTLPMMPVGQWMVLRYNLQGDNESYDVSYSDTDGNILMTYTEIVAHELGVMIKEDKGEIDAAIVEVLATNEKAVNDYKGGKKNAINALFGQVMKRVKGADSKLVREKLEKTLNN